MFYSHRSERFSPRSARAIKKALAELLAERDRVDDLIRNLLHESEQTADAAGPRVAKETAQANGKRLDSIGRGGGI